ncbi:hypothetical protein Tco_0001658 [Tanacetum coccineum]
MLRWPLEPDLYHDIALGQKVNQDHCLLSMVEPISIVQCNVTGNAAHLISWATIAPAMTTSTAATTASSMIVSFGWILEEIHMTWAYLEKKWTRLRLYTKSPEEILIQTVETASPSLARASERIRDGVRILKTVSESSRLKRNPRSFIDATTSGNLRRCRDKSLDLSDSNYPTYSSVSCLQGLLVVGDRMGFSESIAITH